MRVCALAMVGLICAVAPLRADLTEEWSRTSPNLSLSDSKVGVFGDAYLTGTFGSGETNIILTLKYSPSGSLVWSNRYTGPNSADDRSSQMLVDAQDNCYVLGRSTGTNTHVGYGHRLDDVVLLKYSAAGQQLWVSRFSSPHRIDIMPGRITLDTNGNVYATVIERDAQGYPTSYPGSTHPQFYVVKVASGGNQLWATNYPSQAPSTFKIYSTPAVVTRPSGGLLIACEDGVLRFQADGTQASNIVLPQVQGGPIIPKGLAFDRNGNLYTAGAAYSPNIAVLAKYNQESSILWTNTAFALGAASYPGAPYSIVLDNSGNCYAGGYAATANSAIAFAFLLKCSGNGERLWDSWRQMDAYGHFAVPQFALGKGDYVYMAYAGPPNPYLGPGNSELALVKFWPQDGRNQELRYHAQGTLAYPYAIGTDAANNVFMAGCDVVGGMHHTALVKYNDPAQASTPPSFRAPAMAAGGQFQVQFICTPNNNYEIQASTDLKQWTNVMNYSAPQATNTLMLPGGTGLRFYRALVK